MPHEGWGLLPRPQGHALRPLRVQFGPPSRCGATPFGSPPQLYPRAAKAPRNPPTNTPPLFKFGSRGGFHRVALFPRTPSPPTPRVSVGLEDKPPCTPATLSEPPATIPLPPKPPSELHGLGNGRMCSIAGAGVGGAEAAPASGGTTVPLSPANPVLPDRLWTSNVDHFRLKPKTSAHIREYAFVPGFVY